MNVRCMGFECVRGGFDLFVRVEVYVVGERDEFTIHHLY